MRDPLAPIIDGFDLSGIVNRYSFRCESFQEEGENGGTMLDGSTVRDVLAHKVRLSWTINALSAQQYAALCAALRSGDTPGTVVSTVFDPTINARYTAPFHVTGSPVFSFAFDCNGQYMAFADGALVLEEKGDEKSMLYVVASGDFWELYNTGLLDIYCNGPIPDYHSADYKRPPWEDYKSQVTDVIIQDSVTRIGDDTFYNHPNITNVTIPDSVTSIGSGAFSQCTSLENCTIPNDIDEIDSLMFYGCTSLTSVTIPGSVSFIGNDAFNGCTSLADVYYGGTENQWNAIELPGGNTPLQNATIHYNSTGPTA